MHGLVRAPEFYIEELAACIEKVLEKMYVRQGTAVRHELDPPAALFPCPADDFQQVIPESRFTTGKFKAVFVI